MTARKRWSRGSRLAGRRAGGWAICLLLALTSWADAAEEDELRLWLVLNLAPVEAEVSQKEFEAFLADWAGRGIDLYELREQASRNGELRRQVYGQLPVLHQLAAFRAGRPSFPKIEVNFYGWDEYWDSLRTALPSRRADLLQVPSTWCSSLAGGLQMLRPLPDPVAADAKLRFDQPLLDPCLVYGHEPLYGLPWLVDVRLLYYWRSDLPTLEEEFRTSRDIRTTFRQVLRASKAGVDHPLFGLPTARDWELLHQTSLLAWGEGGDLVETHTRLGYRWSSTTIREPALQGAERIVELAREELIALPRSTRQELEAAFVDHRLGSVISGPWLLKQLREKGVAGDAIGVALPPFYGRTPVTFVGGTLLAVTGNRQNVAGPALDLGRFLTTGDAALQVALAAGLVPADRQARGTAAKAQAPNVDRSPAACATYFECLKATGHTVAAAEVLERGLEAGKTYPALPDWWTLEVPSRLGSLYHFWQEMAALQPRDSLDSILRTLSDEWDDSLLAGPRFAVRIAAWTIGPLALVVIAVAITWRRRHALALERELRQQLEDQLRKIKAELERQKPGADNPVVKQMFELTQSVLEHLKLGRGATPASTGNSQRSHRTIVLPVQSGSRLTVAKNDRAIEGIEAMTARVIERVVRRTLLEGRPTFSIVTCAIDLWPTRDDLPEKPKGRWEGVVAAMRKGFDSKPSDEVIARGQGGAYRFSLSEQDYTLQIGPTGPNFIDAVRTPFEEVKRLRHRDSAAALQYALQAYEAERELFVKDPDVVAAVYALGSKDRNELAPEHVELLLSAERDLKELLQRYRAFFEQFPTADELLRSAGLKEMSEGLLEHWQELKETLSTLEHAGKGITGIVLPPEIKKAWEMAAQLGGTLGREAPSDFEFGKALTTILEYWKLREGPDIERILGLSSRLPLGSKRQKGYADWVNRFPEVVLEELTTKARPEESLLLMRLDEFLARDFWRAVEHDSDHVLLAMASGGNPDLDRVIRARVRSRLPALDLSTAFNYLSLELEASQN
jgi:ABC-type glycerol-3-phosphate transport system substrate-binding protein